MTAGFSSAILVGDLFLAVRGAPSSSIEFIYGVVGFSLAQIFWTIGQLREAKPDMRIFLAAAVPLAAFVLARLGPPVLPASAEVAVFAYSMLTAISFAAAVSTRRVFYTAGIGLLLFSDLMIGGRLLRAPGCGAVVGPAYIAAELCLVASFFQNSESRFRIQGVNVRAFTMTGGAFAFACFVVAAVLYPGGGYNPFLKMLSSLGRTAVGKVVYPACHFWFMAGMAFAVVAVTRVWTRLESECVGWRRAAVGWGGAVNVAGLLTLALVPENVVEVVHNLGCNLAALGAVAIAAALFRRGVDMAWAFWFVALLSFFVVCLSVKAIPFSPWVTSTQKVLIASFAVWVATLSWRFRSAVPLCDVPVRGCACR